MFDTLRYRLGGLGGWPRRIAAAMCLTLAIASAIDAHAAHQRPTVPVVVARHAVAAGQSLQAGDLEVVRWSRAIAPQLRTDSVGAVVGRRAAGPIGQGEPITSNRLMGHALALGLRSHTSAVPVQVTERRIADFVSPGDHVDLYAAATDPPPGAAAPPPTRVAHRALVLAVLPAVANDTAGESPAELVVAVGAAEALQIAVNSRQMFAVVLDPT